MIRKSLNGTYRLARRIVIAVVGFSVVLVGVIMIVTPGPAIVVIPAGLAILGAEFAFARRWLRKLKDKSKEAVDGLRGNKARPTTEMQAQEQIKDKTQAQLQDADQSNSVPRPDDVSVEKTSTDTGADTRAQ